MKYKVLIMASLIIGGLSFISCNQQGKSQQATEAARSEEVPEEEDIIISKDKDWSERMLVFKNGSTTDTLTLYRNGTSTYASPFASGYKLNGYWEQGFFKRGDTEYPAVKVSFNSEYSNKALFMEVWPHEGDYIYDKYECLLKKAYGHEILHEEVYR